MEKDGSSTTLRSRRRRLPTRARMRRTRRGEVNRMGEAFSIERVFRMLGGAMLAGSLAGSGAGQSPAQVLESEYELLWTAQSAPGGSELEVVPSKDLDYDTWDDVLVGDPLFSNGAGRARAFSGASGTVLWETVGSQSWGATGPPPGELMGISMAVLDWDGDGASDVAIGAPQFANSPWPSFQWGRLRIVRGSDGGVLSEYFVPPILQNLSIGGEVLGFGTGLGVGGDVT